jgi:hypothetical protein
VDVVCQSDERRVGERCRGDSMLDQRCCGPSRLEEETYEYCLIFIL